MAAATEHNVFHFHTLDVYVIINLSKHLQTLALLILLMRAQTKMKMSNGKLATYDLVLDILNL